MSREIKFSYVWQHNETGRFLEQFHTLDGIENGDVTAHIADHQRKRYTLVARREFTGLKDKNGKEIYEGDVLLSHTTDFTYAVSWNEAEAKFQAIFSLYGMEPAAWERSEVIGNIYENPELLNGEDSIRGEL